LNVFESFVEHLIEPQRFPLLFAPMQLLSSNSYPMHELQFMLAGPEQAEFCTDVSAAPHAKVTVRPTNTGTRTLDFVAN